MPITFGAYWPLVTLVAIPAIWFMGRRTLTDLTPWHLRLSAALRSLIMILLMLAMMQPVFDRTGKWLSVVGIGEDGLAGLGENARRRIETAAHVFGGKRHLELAAPAIRGTRHVWPSPFDREMLQVRALRGERVCVLASGDPFWHGVGVTLAAAGAAAMGTDAVGAAFAASAALSCFSCSYSSCVITPFFNSSSAMPAKAVDEARAQPIQSRSAAFRTLCIS